jgi:hypothetical protein
MNFRVFLEVMNSIFGWFRPVKRKETVDLTIKEPVESSVSVLEVYYPTKTFRESYKEYLLNYKTFQSVDKEMKVVTQ